MITIDESRNYFPYLDSGKIYFNHAAISPLSKVVKNKIDDYLHIRTETEIEPYFQTLPQASGAKEKLASLLKVSSNNIAWSPNVSDSLNVLAQGINWNTGDEIILNSLEFPSNVYPFLNLKKKGVNIIFAKPENGKVDLKQIEKVVTSRTKLISISMVQFLTGYRADLKQIGSYCKSKNIIFCVDGIQGLGVVPVDVSECNIDFFAGGSHKWLMGLQGLGYFYISNELLEVVEQKYIGWTSVKDAWNLTQYNMIPIESADKFQNGTLPRLAIIALNASLSFFEELGSENIERQISKNSMYFINRLYEHGYDLVLKDVEPKNIAGIVSFKSEDAEGIVNKLTEKNIICSIREGLIRVSPHFYNTKEEIDTFIGELNYITNK